MPAVQTKLETFVSPDELKEVILKFEEYPDFMDEVTSVDVLERSDTKIRCTFHIDLSFGGFEIKSHYTVSYAIEERSITWELEESPVLTQNRGSWRLEETEDEECVAHYEGEVETNLAIPPEIQAEFAKSELPKLMGKIRDRAERMD